MEKNFGELSRTLAANGETEFIEDFLRCLLTPAETADIAARWALVKALDEVTANYILTCAEATRQTPAAVIAGLVREKLAML